MEGGIGVWAWEGRWGGDGGNAVGGEGGDGSGIENVISGEWDWAYIGHLGCLFSMLGIYNRRKNGLKWAFVSIEFRKNTYFNCAFMPCFALESDLRNWWGKR